MKSLKSKLWTWTKVEHFNLFPFFLSCFYFFGAFLKLSFFIVLNTTCPLFLDLSFCAFVCRFFPLICDIINFCASFFTSMPEDPWLYFRMFFEMLIFLFKLPSFWNKFMIVMVVSDNIFLNLFEFATWKAITYIRKLKINIDSICDVTK